MDKRFFLAIGLSLLILVGWQYLFPVPKPVPAPASPQAAASPAPSAAPTPPAPGGEAPVPAVAAPPSGEVIAAEAAEDVKVETSHHVVVLTNRGARVSSWRLKDYPTAKGNPLEVVPAAARRADRLPFALDLENAELSKQANAALYRVQRVPTADGETIRFSWADGRGLSVTKSLTFHKSEWLVDVQIEAAEAGRALPVRVVWGPGFEADDEMAGQIPLSGQHYVGQAVLRTGPGLPVRLPASKVDRDVQVPADAALPWAGLEETFFAALILPDGSRGGAVVRPETLPPAEAGGKALPASTIAVGLPDGRGKIYVGPKKYSLLTGLGHDLKWVVFFSSYELIYWLAKILFLALVWTHDHVLANYGVAIILATIGLRLVFFPLNQYSMVKMRKTAAQMQRVQPKIKAIQAKYKKSKDADARVKMNEEMMALYRKEGINPFGGVSGCLPMLVQLPVLYAFYNVLSVAVELRRAPFYLWIQDLTLKDPTYVTPILMGITMFVQQKMNPAAGADPTQQRMMLLMPIVFTVMFINMPSGLVLYWFVNNLLGIGQQWLVNRHIERLQNGAERA